MNTTLLITTLVTSLMLCSCSLPSGDSDDPSIGGTQDMTQTQMKAPQLEHSQRN